MDNQNSENNDLNNLIQNKLNVNWEIDLPRQNSKDGNLATRQSSQKCLKYISTKLKHITAGSADLAGSCLTSFEDKFIDKDNYQNRLIHYGIREHAMCGIANGMSTQNIIPFVSTFLTFVSYCLGSIRLAAISKHKVVYVFTHDSIGVGEDGPTHQPVEIITILRSIPNLLTIRPCDGNEVSGAQKVAINYEGPTAICLSRQSLPHFDNSSIDNVNLGGQILQENKDNDIDLIIIATGSEVSLCYKTITEEFKDKGIRLVSMPCTEKFDQNTEEQKNEILPKKIYKISVEAGVTLGWYKYANKTIGLDTFGMSAKASDVMEQFGFSVKNIKKEINTFQNNLY